MEMNRELTAFQIITNAGTAKSHCFEAIGKAKLGQISKANELVEKSNDYFNKAHAIHREMIKEEASGETVWMSLLLTHSEDILITSELMKDVTKEFIGMYEEIREIKEQMRAMEKNCL